MGIERVVVSPFGSTAPTQPAPSVTPPKTLPPDATPTVRLDPPVRPALPRVDAWQAAAGEKETAVPLSRLPAGLEFTEGFPEPIRYDPARRVLVYRGLMASGSYTDLRRLSRDVAYLLAVDDLYVATSLPESRLRTWVVLGLAVGLSVLAGGAWWVLR